MLKFRCFPSSSRTQLGRIQHARAAQLLASGRVLLKSATHVNELEYKRRGAEYVPRGMALEERLGVAAAEGERRKGDAWEEGI